ncbi:MAG: glycosyltransferase family 4 protein [Thermodesulfobacteriota bacterium]
MRKLKLLFQSRKTLFSVPGGDTIQMLKTAEHLKSLGCHVDVSTELDPSVTGYDLVHLFNLMRPQEVYLQALNAKRYGKKVALSTIYGPYLEYEKKARGGLAGLLARRLRMDRIEYLKILARALKNLEWNPGTAAVLKKGYRKLQSEIIDMADLFLPNSESEMERVISDFPEARRKPHAVVPNAVDAELFGQNEVRVSEDLSQFKDCVLCVARIEGRKNQLNLVRAANRVGYQLVLVGKPAPNHASYFRKILKESRPNIHVVGHVSHEKLPRYYSVAKVHAMPSWMETPGLSSLEAGAAGCNIVVTEKGDTRDYFEEYAFYCEPDSIESIGGAIEKARRHNGNGHLREHILRNFTWQNAAGKTKRGYDLVL